MFIFTGSVTVLAFGNHSQGSLGLDFSICRMEMVLYLKSQALRTQVGHWCPEVSQVKKGQKKMVGRGLVVPGCGSSAERVGLGA